MLRLVLVKRPVWGSQSRLKRGEILLTVLEQVSKRALINPRKTSFETVLLGSFSR